MARNKNNNNSFNKKKDPNYEINILRKGAFFIMNGSANDLIKSQVNIQNNIYQKIHVLNEDYRTCRDQTITGDIENAITSLASVLHPVFITRVKRNSNYKPEVVSDAYRSINLSYPGTCFDFLSVLFSEYNDREFNSALDSLKRKTKGPGDMVRHNNVDLINEIDEIVDNYNIVIDHIADNANLPAVKKYRINATREVNNLRVENGRRIAAYVCPLCGKGVGSQEGLKHHMQAKHTNNPSTPNTNNNQTKQSEQKVSKPKAKRSKIFVIRLAVSLFIGLVLFVAGLFIFPLAAGLKFITGLWISAIIFYASTAFTYECFKGKLCYKIFAFIIKAYKEGYLEVVDSYSLKMVFKILISIFFFLICVPAAAFLVTGVNLIVAAAAFPVVLIIDLITDEQEN